MAERRDDDGSRKPRAHILNHKQEVERTLGMTRGYEVSKPAPSKIFPPARPHLLKPTQTALPNEDQVFNPLSLWGHSHSSCHRSLKTSEQSNNEGSGLDAREDTSALLEPLFDFNNL